MGARYRIKKLRDTYTMHDGSPDPYVFYLVDHGDGSSGATRINVATTERIMSPWWGTEAECEKKLLQLIAKEVKDGCSKEG